MSKRVLAALALAMVACSREDEMRAVAGQDFGCPAEQIRILELRSDISEPTWEIRACGHHARYTCHVGDRRSSDPDKRRHDCVQDLEYRR
jgi:hypothetical protein